MATAKKRRRAGTPRASWRGQMTFGLVSFPVEAWNAHDKARSDIHFHMLHKTCHRRIHYAKMCPVHGEVSNDEIVSGYEVKKNQYIEIDPEELDRLRPENDRALRIDAFVAPDAIDPLYFDGRMYYLAPTGAGKESYAVMARAMENAERCAVGQIIMSGKRQLVLVRPHEGILQMAMLNYAAEIRAPNKLTPPKNIAKQVHLAETLIGQWSQDDFDFSKYRDDYRDEVKKLIDAKKTGEEIEAPKEKEPKESLDLMEALKRSVAAKSKHRGRRSA
jgi:DNA end-binding protein Ku